MLKRILFENDLDRLDELSRDTEEVSLRIICF